MYSSYLDKIEADPKDQKDYEKLVKFLKGERDDETKERDFNRNPSDISELYIVDVVDDWVKGHLFGILRQSPVDEEFQKALNSPYQENGTRLIMLQVNSLWSINHSYLEAIGQRFELDPGFLFAFISHFRFDMEPLPQPRVLPSEKGFLHTAYKKDTHTTATFVRSKDPDTLTVILLHYELYKDLSGTGIGKTETTSLSGYWPLDLVAAIENPCDFMYPFIKCAAELIASECSNYMAEFFRGFPYMEDVSVDRFYRLTKLVRGNRRNKISLLASKESISRFVETHDPQKSSNLRGLLADFDQLIEYTERIESDTQRELQFIQSSEAVKETRRGIEQGNSVRRLTVVAFIFIPLSFSTSFFGMNISQLNDNGVDIRYFVLAVALTGVAAVLSSIAMKRFEKTKEEIASEVGDLRGKRTVEAKSILGKWFRRSIGVENVWQKNRTELSTELNKVKWEVPTNLIVKKVYEDMRSRTVARVGGLKTFHFFCSVRQSIQGALKRVVLKRKGVRNDSTATESNQQETTEMTVSKAYTV